MTQKNRSKQTRRSGIVIVLLAFCLMIGMVGEARPVAASQVQQASTPTAINDFYAYKPGTTLTVPAPGVLANDKKPDGVTILYAFSSGTLPPGISLNSNGSFTIGSTVTGQVKFEYFACTTPSGDPGTCSTAATVTLDPANCMEDYCGTGHTCGAQDVLLTVIDTYDVKDYCTYEGDTGIYKFRILLQSGAATRYDPTAWIAIDGNNAMSGYCATEYLQPDDQEPFFVSHTDTDPNPFVGPPFWQEEPDAAGHECGDIVANWKVVKITDWITIYCSADVLDGTIDAAVTWDNNATPSNCNDPSTGRIGSCSSTKSKCQAAAVAAEVSIDPIDLQITKTITAGLVDGKIKPGVPFQYTLTVKNNSGKKSHGYNVYDDLPMWLKVVPDYDGDGQTNDDFIPEITDEDAKDFYEDDGTSEDGPWGDKTKEYCATEGDPIGFCAGYGDIVWFNEQRDLAAGASMSYTFWVMLWDNDEATREYCELYGGTEEDPGDPRCFVNGGENPDTISNKACVEGFDNDTVLTNNCGTTSGPTAVELLYFTAKPGEKAITLAWATSNEINNAGFNIYRATSEAGVRIKLNPQLIPAQKGGSPEGAEYLYIDSSLEQPWFKKALDRILNRSTTYYYWLEDVPLFGEANTFGPESAQLLR